MLLILQIILYNIVENISYQKWLHLYVFFFFLNWYKLVN